MYKSAIINFGDCTLRINVELTPENLSGSSYFIEVLDLIVEESGELHNYAGTIEGSIQNWETDDR